ncbi:MAG TPA: glycine cleavage system protein GcvH [Bacteroidales bacterium]|nr:glycine cleavage system protein GcvH [Bacteroidales bacterium]
MNIPGNLRYTKNHEWINLDGRTAFVGITDFAQSELGDIVFLEIETMGEQLDKGEVFGTVEAVKTVSDIFMPVSGKVIEINPRLEDQPQLVNKDPYGEGWLIKVELAEPAQINDLLDAKDYEKLIAS